jgi:hypothetical protein
MGDDSARFRARAIECRTLACATRDKEAQRSLNKTADDLDAEAGRIDADERGDPPISG